MYKNNSLDSKKLVVCSPFQLSCNMTNMKPATGYYSYTKRWQQAKKTRMRIILTIVILTLISTIGLSQSKNENVLYIVDSIPVIEEPKEGFGTLTENEID